MNFVPKIRTNRSFHSPIGTQGPIILGITNNDDASACLVINGEIVAAAQEERFSRIKLDNHWPQNSIAFVLNRANLMLSDVDYLAYGWSTGFNAEKLLLKYLDRGRELDGNDTA